MKLFVRLQKDLPPERKLGLPDAWPAEVEEADDGAPDPSDGRLVMSAAEFDAHKEKNQAAYDAWRAAAFLPEQQTQKCDAIDRRTAALIAEGFVSGALTFSLSTNAQSTLTGLFAVRDEPELKYPVRVNTLDDVASLDLADAGEVRAFYMTAVGTYRAHLDSGTALKDQVRTATTSAEVAAVVDKR